MTVIRATIHDGRLELPAPADCPDGTEVLVEVTPLSEKIGLDETDWRDDAEALADWARWLETIEPIEFAPPDAFDETFRQYNIEAVRQQMFGKSP